MSKKVVLQLCHGYSAPFDDVARQWRSLFLDTDYKIVTVFLIGEPNEQVARLVGGDVVFLGYTSKELRGLKIKQVRALKALHKKYCFCLAIAHRYKSIYIATRLPKIKVIGVSHAFGVYDRAPRKRYITGKSDRLLLVGVSDAIRDDARWALPKFPPEKIQTLYNHIDLASMCRGILSREDARRQLGLESDDFVFGNVGRLHQDKDQATLLNAFAKALHQLPGARIIIIGEGRLRDELERQIENLGLSGRVELKGRVPEAFRYFRAFDVFVLSSNFEPFGMVLLEAMAAGVPVIGSDCGGAPEVLGGGGLLFPVGDADALAQKLREAFSMNEEKKQVMLVTLEKRLHHYFTDEAAKDIFWQQLLSGETVSK